MLDIGIIGCGDIANLNALGYLCSQDAEIIAVCDSDIKRAKEKLERWGLRTVKIYTDYKKLIDNEEIDILEILTPHHLHFSMTEYAAKAGISAISVQKPLAHTITDCDRIIKVCKRENIKLKLYENFRFYPVFLKAKELIQKGLIGEPLNFRINTIAPGGPSMKVDLKSLRWRRNFDSCGGGPWVYDDGIHKFSMALWLMGQERVSKVYAWIDYFSVLMDIPAYIFWEYPHNNPEEPPKYGSMEFTMAPNIYYPNNYYHCDEYIEISGTKGMMWLNQCTGGGNFISKTPQFPPIVIYREGKVEKYGENLPRDWRHSFLNSTRHFIEVVKHGGEPIYTGEKGKNLCIFAKMPYISSQENRIVNWNEISTESEQNNECVVESPSELDSKGFVNFLKKKKADFKKGINQGFKHKEFKYPYEL